jgi:hypothetical protein
MNAATEPKVGTQDVVARLEQIQRRSLDILRRRQGIDQELANARAEENALFEQLGMAGSPVASGAMPSIASPNVMPIASPIAPPEKKRRGRKPGSKNAVPSQAQIQAKKGAKAQARGPGKKKAAKGAKAGRNYDNAKPLKLVIWDVLAESTSNGGLGVDEVAEKILKGKLFTSMSKKPKAMIASHTYSMHGAGEIARHEDTKKYYIEAGTARPQGRERATTE